MDEYYDELIEWTAFIGNFCQLTKDNKNENFQFEETNLEPYKENTSLLFTAETDDYVDFVDGKPGFLVKYHFILSVGSSKDNSDIIAYTNSDLKNCNFYLDYFWVSPLKINEIQCKDKNCNMEENLTHFSWCTNCHGSYHSAHNLKFLMHPKIIFSKLPKTSLIYINKKVTPIDDSLETRQKVKKFLEFDKRKIDILQERVDVANKKIKEFIEIVNKDKEHSLEKINELLSIRGGSLEAYLETIKSYE